METWQDTEYDDISKHIKTSNYVIFYTVHKNLRHENLSPCKVILTVTDTYAKW